MLLKDYLLIDKTYGSNEKKYQYYMDYLQGLYKHLANKKQYLEYKTLKDIYNACPEVFKSDIAMNEEYFMELLWN